MDQQPRHQTLIVLARNYILFCFILLISGNASAQAVDSFLKPADTLNIKRRNAVVISEAVVAGASIAALNQLWYADFPKSDFHFKNDNSEWLQVDKIGHIYASYQLGRTSTELLKWSGVSNRQSIIYGAASGFLFLTAVEIMDGYSSQWGASLGDVAANAGGTVLFVSQELLWKEQRIIPKFSFHTTPYASARPSVLGSTASEQLFKDYNGQTYWLSFNMHSFFKGSMIPKWLNIAGGYGAEGMITANDAFVNTVFLPESERFRQYYISFDVDLTKIDTKSHVLKTIFSIFNSVKVPAPTLEINDKGITKFHVLYF